MAEVFLEDFFLLLDVADVADNAIMFLLRFVHLYRGQLPHLFNFLSQHIVFVLDLIEFAYYQCVIFGVLQVFLLSCVFGCLLGKFGLAQIRQHFASLSSLSHEHVEVGHAALPLEAS